MPEAYDSWITQNRGTFEGTNGIEGGLRMGWRARCVSYMRQWRTAWTG